MRELVSYSDRHEGERVILTGEVFNVRASDGFLQMHVVKPGGSEFDTEAVVVRFTGSILPAGTYEESVITVYGTASGLFEGTNAMGASIDQPEVEAQIIDLDSQ